MALRLGSDTGGTFTDLVTLDEDTGRLSIHKVSSTPTNPAQAIVQGTLEAVTQIGAEPSSVSLLVHGTTVATNAVLQRRGAQVALITTAGFRDVLHIQRQDRPRLYDLRARRARPLVPRRMRFELNERMRYDGTVQKPIDSAELDKLIERLSELNVEAVAVGFLHSYANPAHEIQVGERLKSALPNTTVCLSHEIVGEHGEYERFSTCAMNAFVQPVMQHYVGSLEEQLQRASFTAPLFVMKSNGGMMSAEAAGRQCVETILSGPAGGVVAGSAMATAHHNQNLITADMGGTSFDVSVIHQGQPAFARDSEMGGLVIGVPMLDIHTVGAGGGSIAWTDDGGSLRVGPESAGAAPGPACYGAGGTRPTVTDANLVLGRLSAASLLGGEMMVDQEAARRAIHDHVAQPLGLSDEAAAEGIIRVVNATMTAAIRKLTVERGLDPRDFVLCPFGGAGPLHATELASEMGISECLIPIAPGVTSALGLLMCNLREDRVRTFVTNLAVEQLPRINELFVELRQDAESRLGFTNAAKTVKRSLGMRYRGQRYELVVEIDDGELQIDAIAADLHREHERMYGYLRREETIEISSVWVRVEVDMQAANLPLAKSGRSPEPVTTRPVIFSGAKIETPIYKRSDLAADVQLKGPAIIEQLDSTTVIWPEQDAQIDQYGQIIGRMKL